MNMSVFLSPNMTDMTERASYSRTYTTHGRAFRDFAPRHTMQHYGVVDFLFSELFLRQSYRSMLSQSSVKLLFQQYRQLHSR